MSGNDTWTRSCKEQANIALTNPVGAWSDKKPSPATNDVRYYASRDHHCWRMFLFVIIRVNVDTAEVFDGRAFWSAYMSLSPKPGLSFPVSGWTPEFNQMRDDRYSYFFKDRGERDNDLRRDDDHGYPPNTPPELIIAHKGLCWVRHRCCTEDERRVIDEQYALPSQQLDKKKTKIVLPTDYGQLH